MRKSVEKFANAMEEKLQKNDHKGGWKDCPNTYLQNKLLEELTEYFIAHGYRGLPLVDKFITYVRRAEQQRDDIKSLPNPIHCIEERSELVDIGNIAMMLYDNMEEE